jgi:hypothetical protein
VRHQALIRINYRRPHQPQSGDTETARPLGLPLERFHNVPLGAIDAMTRDFVEPIVRP